MGTMATIEGDGDEGFNVKAHISDSLEVVFGCEDREHAEELAAALERCPFFSMQPAAK